MILEGVTLTIIGMIVVFVFLTLLVVVMQILSAFVQRFMPEPVKPVRVQAGAQHPEIAAALAAVSALLGKPIGTSAGGQQAEIAAAVAAVKVRTS